MDYGLAAANSGCLSAEVMVEKRSVTGTMSSSRDFTQGTAQSTYRASLQQATSTCHSENALTHSIRSSKANAPAV